MTFKMTYSRLLLTFEKVKGTTNRGTVESLNSNAQSSVFSNNRISQNTVTFDTDDLDIGGVNDNYAPKKSSIEELIRRVSI